MIEENQPLLLQGKLANASHLKEIHIAAINNNIRSSYVVLEGEHGHDSFLFHTNQYSQIIRKFIES